MSNGFYLVIFCVLFIVDSEHLRFSAECLFIFRIFSEGGNFSPEEVDEHRKRLVGVIYVFLLAILLSSSRYGVSGFIRWRSYTIV